MQAQANPYTDLEERRRVVQRFLDRETARVVDAWWYSQCRNPYAAIYLYYKPSEGKSWGALATAEEAPEGYKLARGERISPAWTQEAAGAFIREWSRNLPLLPPDGF